MKLIQNIKQLLVTGDYPTPVSGKDMADLQYIEDAYLYIEDGLISDFGKMEDLHLTTINEVIDATGQIIMPCYCDSHTHLVYAASREKEFVSRITGKTYQEIAAAGGGILNSAKKLQSLSEDALFKDAKNRLQRLIQLGTGAIEIKSGYGLTYESELKMLKVIRRLSKHFDIPIKATLLAAHALPKTYAGDADAYLEHIITQMLPDFVKEGLVDFVDIFCEEGYFTVAHLERLLHAAKQLDIQGKAHVNQFNTMGGITAAVDCKALSVDHLEVLSTEDIDALENSKTIATALPGCSYFLNIPYTAARSLLERNVALAIATDYNPGSAPSGNMNFILSEACIHLKMTPSEAIIAATINGAFAMDVAKEVGSISIGKKANFIITQPISSFEAIPYYFGDSQIADVYINGESIYVT